MRHVTTDRVPVSAMPDAPVARHVSPLVYEAAAGSARASKQESIPAVPAATIGSRHG